MKTLNCFLILVLTALSFNLSAQTVDEIIAKNLDAMGGKTKLMTLKTLKMSGSMSVQGADVTMVATRSHLTGSRLDIEVMGTSNYQVANATKGATFMPVFGMAAPQDMSTAEYQTAAALMDIQSPFLNYKEKGSTIELKGTEKIDGSDAYNLKVTYKNGKVVNYFIDSKTNRLVKTSSVEVVNGEEVQAETSYSNYKQNADGFWFPYSVTNSRGTIDYTGIETNIPVDDSIYKN